MNATLDHHILTRARNDLIIERTKITDRELRDAVNEAINVLDSALWRQDRRIRNAYVAARNA